MKTVLFIFVLVAMSLLLGAFIGGIIATAIAYPMGLSKGKKEYEDKKEVLRQRLLEQLPNIPVPEWVNLPDVLPWLQTAPSEDVLKWAIQALNMVIDKWETQSQFITAIMESLKQAFQVPPTLSPRLTRKLERAIAKEIETKVAVETKPIII